MSGAKLDQAVIDKMREIRAAGIQLKEIAKELGTAYSTISKYTAGLDGKAKWARQEIKKKDPIPRQHFRWKFCWTADKEYARIQDARRLREAQRRQREYPCEHCQWRMDGAKDIVCLGYCELWGAQNKKAPARSCTSDRRTAPIEAASELPLS